MNLTKPAFDEQEMILLRDCLNSGWVTQGTMVRRFEAMFVKRHKVKFALATSSCTTALHLAIMALDIGPGDEVIVPAFTWVTSANCVEYVNAKVVFADVEEDTFNISPTSLEAAITPNTKAVVVVHLFGLAAKMDEIIRIARKHQLYIVEDAACAIGTTYDSKPVGGLGDIGCFSFHPRKIVTTGEGGMITTNHEKYSDKIASLKNHGASTPPNTENTLYYKPYQMDDFNVLGYNFRLSDIQASIGIAQMGKLESFLTERRVLAERYYELLQDIEEILLPQRPGMCGHTFQSFVIRVKEGGLHSRNRLMDELYAHGIQTRPGTHAVHRLGYYRKKYNLQPSDFPKASVCEDTSVTLPLYPDMTEEDQLFVVQRIKESFSAQR